MKRKLSILLTGLLLVFAFNACEDLEVENLNRPDFDETNAPAQVFAKVGGILNGLQISSHTFDEPLLAVFGVADAGTCSWGNFGMRDIASEPRVAFNNTPNYSNRLAFENYYLRLYQYLSISNDALQAITQDVDGEVQEPQMCKAVAYYGQAYTLGHVGMFYDKGFVVTHVTDLTAEVPMVSYSVLIDSAIAQCDKAIAICNNATFTIPQSWLPTNETYTNVEFGRLVNTLAARLLTYKSRNKAQNDANDWNRILSYASKGIQMDYSPIMDDVTWYDYHKWYNIRDGWGRIDMRVINLMDPAMYPWFPASGNHTDLPNNGKAVSDDARLESDFQYMASQAFYANRGIYHYSTYRLKRYDEYRDTYIGPLAMVMWWENAMIEAEALVRTGDVPGAAAILNDPDGPRKVRGGLDDVPAVEADVLAAIFYEKTIECILTTENTEFYDMRRRDMLQKGTMTHFPIPAQQLEILEIPFYTFGGTTGEAGLDYSTGGWETVSDFYKKETYGY
ncbi:MAG: hypothetical protein JXA72_04235 [Bacteroidales bacterium]|nr:hypothetical protein [Bacteroidales bacterium]